MIEYGALHAGRRRARDRRGHRQGHARVLARGLAVHALEPSPGMAAVLRGNGRRGRGDDVRGLGADARLRSGSCSPRRRGTGCTAPTATRRSRPRSAPGGTLALFWNKGREWTGAARDRQRRRLRRARARAHELGRQVGARPDASTRSRPSTRSAADEARVHVEQTVHDPRVADAARHALRPPDPARGAAPRLHAAVGHAINKHGGRVDVTYDVDALPRDPQLAARSVGHAERDRGSDPRRGRGPARRSRATRR